MEKEDNLKEDLKFGSYEDVDKYVKEWSDANLSPFIIRSSFQGNENSNGRIQYVCPHGVERTSKSRGGRPRQHVMHTDCPVRINVNQNRKDNTWTVTKVVKKHQGHMLGPDVYGGYQKFCKMSSADVQFVNELDAVGASRRRIAERMGEKTGNAYNTKDIYNIVSKLKNSIADGGVLEKYLRDVQADGGDVQWNKNEGGR